MWFAGATRKQVQEATGESIIAHLRRRTRGNPRTVTERPDHMGEEEFKEHMTRMFCAEFAKLLGVLTTENICTTECGQMRATEEWTFLCSAHPKPRECSALDYIHHTVDHCTGVILQKSGSISSVLRRLYRILAHLHFHHDEFFFRWEEKTSLCLRLTSFLEHFALVPKETFIVPKSVLANLLFCVFLFSH